MRIPVALAAALTLAASGCAAPLPPVAGSCRGIEVRPHYVEIPRIPHPLYLADGVQIAAMDGDGPAAGAGLLAGDVVSTVDGKEIRSEEDFLEAWGDPACVRVVRSRTGTYGGRIVEIETGRR